MKETLKFQNKVKVRVFRFDPSKDKNPRYNVYEVPLIRNETVLGILNYIYENLDSSLAYYSSCRLGLCGGCTVIVNGKAVQACKAIVKGDITIDPLPRYEIIRDLVVNPKKKLKTISRNPS